MYIKNDQKFNFGPIDYGLTTGTSVPIIHW